MIMIEEYIQKLIRLRQNVDRNVENIGMLYVYSTVST